MNSKGLTLIEIIVSLALISIIMISIVPAMSLGYMRLIKTREITKDTFDTIQKAERQMEVARTDEIDGDDPSETVDIFGKMVEGHLVKVDIPATGEAAHGEISVFVPKYKVVYDVPIVDSVSLELYRDGTLIEPIPDSVYPLDSTVALEGSQVDGPQDEFLLNVYRWYMSPVTDTAPTNIRDYIIIKEWNEARAPVSYEDSDDFKIIPNIEEDYDILDFSEFGFTDEEINERFAGRFFVYSVTPYSTIGRVGEEKFSNIISMNRIVNVEDVYTTVPVGTTYNITDYYSTVPAEMQNGDIVDVDVIWSPPVIDITTPGVKPLSHGTIIGYPDGIDFHLTASNIAVTGIDILDTAKNLIEGDSYTLTAVITPDNASNKGINWSSSNPSAVSVDAGGQIAALAPSVSPVTITATSVDGGYMDTCSVTVAARVPTTITVTGSTAVLVPCSGSKTYTYTAVIKDQTGTVMPDETVTWSLVGAVAGISIDSDTGVLTVSPSAVTGTFRVRASSDTNASAYGELTVAATKPGRPANSTSYASVVNQNSPRRAVFTATVKDADGNNISGLTMDDFMVSHITTASAEFKTLTDIDAYAVASDYSVYNFAETSEGVYTWTIRRVDGSGNVTRDNVGVQVRNPNIVQNNYMLIQENLDGVRIR